MARWNKNTAVAKPDTENLAGGEAHQESAKLELVSILLTSFVKDDFYRKGSETAARVKVLVAQMAAKGEAKFAAKASIFARQEFHMRSITHVTAGEIAKHVKGETWTKGYFKKVFHRADDMMETVAYYVSQYGKRPIPNSLKKGVRLAVGNFDEYQLSKYRGEGKDFKLIDLVNLTHPKPNGKAKTALKKLVEGKLKSTKTWEAKLTKAGQVAETEEEKQDLKADAWKELLEKGQLGYFALLRNLRNILEQAPDCVPMALKQLMDKDQIAKSKVLPFRYLSALEEVLKVNNSRPVVGAIATAFEIACSNVPELPGKTLVCIDKSSSMAGQHIRNACILGAVFYKANNADLLLFDTQAAMVNMIPTMPALGLAQAVENAACKQMGGTDFNVIFPILKNKYDRILILSDMQAWVGYNTPKEALKAYKKRMKADPRLYCIDLAGLGTLQFPEKNVYAMAGFSDKIFDLMKIVEQDRGALIKKIEAIEL